MKKKEIEKIPFRGGVRADNNSIWNPGTAGFPNI